MDAYARIGEVCQASLVVTSKMALELAMMDSSQPGRTAQMRAGRSNVHARTTYVGAVLHRKNKSGKWDP